jgi:outer membrane protein assembly factor BamB
VPPIATTICCRFFARTATALSLAAAALAVPAAQQKASQSLPAVTRWSVELSAAAIAPPVVAADAVVAVPLHEGGIAAFRLRDGSSAWRSELAASQPLAADDTHLYVVAADTVHALDATSGASRWRAPVSGVSVPPVARGGWLILAGDAGVSAVRAADGHELWRAALGAVKNRPAIDGDVLYVPVAGARIVALDLESGSIRWQRPLGGDPGEPYAVGGRVYAGAEDRFFYALDARDGDIEWSARTGAAPRGRPAADHEHVYLVGLDNVLYTFDRGDGALRWRAGVTYRPVAGPAIVGGALIVPGPTTALAAYDTERGVSAGRIELGGSLATIPEFVALEHDRAHLLVITGDLQASWKMSLLGPELVPRLPVAPLKELPGVPVPLAPAGGERLEFLADR